MTKKSLFTPIGRIVKKILSNPRVQKIIWGIVARAAEWGIERAIKWIDKKKRDKEKKNSKSNRSSKISESN